MSAPKGTCRAPRWSLSGRGRNRGSRWSVHLHAERAIDDDPSALHTFTRPARLAAIAPLQVVRGNNDTAPWAQAIPASARLDVGGVGIHVIHDLKELDIDPRAAGVRVVVAGHTHRPASAERAGTLYVNPGSAGRRRFSLPIAAGELLIDAGKVEARLVTLAQ